MALHTALPIYKVAYDLFDISTDLAKNMPRDFKASIGGKLRDECVEIVTLIFRANVARDKAPHLGTLIERVQVVELMRTIPTWTTRLASRSEAAGWPANSAWCQKRKVGLAA